MALLSSALCIAWLFSVSPGIPLPLHGADGYRIQGSISEKIETNINGVNQGMILRGCDARNPILLYVHGGPGVPEYALSEKYPSRLEEHFTLCWWEQRGVGLSYAFTASAAPITEEQLILDTLEVTRYLQKRFGQERIYLLGHSWGSYIALQAAARFPQYYQGYIGMSQVSNTRESERLGYQYILNRIRASGNTRMAKKLLAYPVMESEAALYSYFTSQLRVAYLHSLKLGTMYSMRSRFWGMFVPILQCRAYTLGEKFRIWRSSIVIQKSSILIREFYEADLPSRIRAIPLPLYFISGIYDQTVSAVLAEDMLKKIDAPVKGFYIFTRSANSPLFEEPERFVAIMADDVLKGLVGLADGNYAP